MKLKKTGSIVLVIATILFLLFIVVTPSAANGGPNGNHAFQPVKPGGSADGYEGQFLVIICGSSAGYDWVEGWPWGTTLAEPVSQVGTCYICPGNRYPCPGTEYKIEIPEGTVVGGYYTGQGRVVSLEVKIVDGHLYFSPNLRLSQPAILYKLVDGEWVEVLSFTEVLNGKVS